VNNNIIWTNHSLERLRERDIDKQDIEKVIENPTELINENYNKYKCFSEVYNTEPKYLIVVYTIDNKCIKVITVFKAGRGGVKVRGFKI
jgi:hypothetical protein